MNTVHVFEAKGLGIAPFHIFDTERRVYIAVPGADPQPGATCDFCGTGIMNVFLIASADGRQFKVGSDCVARTGDAGLKKELTAIERKRKAEMRKLHHEKEEARISAAKAQVECVTEKLSALPHPLIQGYTLLGYVQYLFQNGGHSGQLRAARIVERALES